MMMRLLAVVAVTMAGTVVWAEDFVHPNLGQVQTGILCQGPVAWTDDSPETILGQTGALLTFPPFVSESHTVPAVRGMMFGVRSVPQRGSFPDARIVVTHPPLGEEAVTTQSWSTDFDPYEVTGNFYAFDFDYELVEGLWTIEAWFGDELLYRFDFKVVAPGVVPELAQVCGYEDLLF